MTALEPVETLGLHRDTIDELRQQHPSVDRFLLGVAVAEVRRLSTQLLDALYVPVAKRIPRRLAELVELYGGGDGDVVIPLNQEDLAGLCGTTRPTTNQVLMDLQDKGVITVGRGKVTVTDRAALARLGSR
jgi:CRP-like cAMP-binding protein